jgi:hypothetical protein
LLLGQDFEALPKAKLTEHPLFPLIVISIIRVKPLAFWVYVEAQHFGEIHALQQ